MHFGLDINLVHLNAPYIEIYINTQIIHIVGCQFIAPINTITQRKCWGTLHQSKLPDKIPGIKICYTRQIDFKVIVIECAACVGVDIEGTVC